MSTLLLKDFTYVKAAIEKGFSSKEGKYNFDYPEITGSCEIVDLANLINEFVKSSIKVKSVWFDSSRFKIVIEREAERTEKEETSDVIEQKSSVMNAQQPEESKAEKLVKMGDAYLEAKNPELAIKMYELAKKL